MKSNKVKAYERALLETIASGNEWKVIKEKRTNREILYPARAENINPKIVFDKLNLFIK